MNMLIILYHCNVWHQTDSKVLIGIYTDEDKLYEDVAALPFMTDWDVQFFKEQRQTQSDSETERDYEVIADWYYPDELNKIDKSNLPE